MRQPRRGASGETMNIPSLQQQVSAEEWQLRVDLAACYRLVAAYGWSDLVFTHISAKLPSSVAGDEHQFLINPYGLMFDEITASSLVKVDMQCNKLHDSPFPVNPAGFVIHSAIHEDEKTRLQADLGTANYLMLRNHGLLTVGRNIPEAFLAMYTFENTCRIQIDALAGGSEVVHVNPAILDGVAHAMKVQTSGLGGQFVWPSLLRKLERLDPGYKT